MGKPTAYPAAKSRPGLSPAVWVAIILGVLLLGLLTYLVWNSRSKVEAPLPAAPASQLPDLPLAPPLPNTNQKPPPAGAPLPDTNVPAPQAAPAVTEAPKVEQAGASGQITWWWNMGPLSPQVLNMPVPPTQGYGFVSLRVLVLNSSSEAVAVDHNAFTVTVDGQTYKAELGNSVVSATQEPFLVPTTLQPGARTQGGIGFMIPATYARVSADWRPTVSPGIKIVRIDPQAASGGGNQ